MAKAKKHRMEDMQEQIEAMETVGSSSVMDEEMMEEEVVAEEVFDLSSGDEESEGACGEEMVAPEMTPDDIRLVEAILFASSTAVSEAAIAERFPQDRVALIPAILEHLREQYEGRGVNLVQRDKRWALRTAVDLGEQLRLEKEQPKKFTRAAMETMAVIAYHQPVTRAEIENIRGVATSPGALDALMEAGWIKPGKRREVPGRPVTWLTTQAFLDHFGLEKLEDLPGMDELKAAGLLDKRPAVEAMPTADLFDESESRADASDPNEITDEDLMGKPLPEEAEGELPEKEMITADADDEECAGGNGNGDDEDDEDDFDISEDDESDEEDEDGFEDSDDADESDDDDDDEDFDDGEDDEDEDEDED